MSPLDDLFQAVVQRHPDRLALALEDAEVSYRALSATVEGLACRLAGDVAPGQRVGVLAPNSPALIAGLFAAWRLGGVAVPLNARWREYELGRILRDAEATALISVEAHHGFDFARLFESLGPTLPALRRALLVDPLGNVQKEVPGPGSANPAPLEPEVALLLYTSGTTGLPKGALLTHAAEVNGAETLNAVLGASDADVVLFVIPISHAFGLACFLAAFAAGSAAVLVESTFSPAPMINAIRGRSATIVHGSPALFSSLLKSSPEGMAPLRTGFVAGSSCPPHLLEQLDAAGLRILNLYGMTEIGAAACCRAEDPARVRHTTVGRPLPGYAFRIDGAGPTGEVLVRGPHVTRGYFRQPDQTAASFTDDWFRTGDVGALDGDGNLVLSGRAKDVIHVAGLNVFPAEVEALLLTHPDVQQAVVIGVPHETIGEVPHAFVVPRPDSGLKPQSLLQYARSRIAGYKLPYAIRLLAEIPLLASGKPDRAALRDADRAATATRDPAVRS